MKESMTCPKCASTTDVVRIPGSTGTTATGSVLYTGLTTASVARLTRFVCCKCGYSEEWLEGSAALGSLKAKYGK
jgi:hypothetical protein